MKYASRKYMASAGKNSTNIAELMTIETMRISIAHTQKVPQNQTRLISLN